MTDEQRFDIVTYRLESAKRLLPEIEDHISHGYYNTAMNRMYYACFYAVSALLVRHEIDGVKCLETQKQSLRNRHHRRHFDKHRLAQSGRSGTAANHCATLAIATRNIGATKASVLGVFEPITAILVGTLMFGEPLTANIIVGITIAILAVTFMVYVTKR